METHHRKTDLRVRLFCRLSQQGQYLAIAVAIVVAITCGLAGTTHAESELKTWIEPHMGTKFTIRAWVASDQTEVGDEAAARAFARVAELNQICSDYVADSEINRLRDSPFGSPVAISETLASILITAQNLSAETDGAFDVTLGPLIRQWRLSRKNTRMPRPEHLTDALARSGYRNLLIDPKVPSATLRVDGMQLDLGGIAKGCAADAALETMKASGFSRSLVAASGDIAIGDPPPGKDHWRVGIRGLESETTPDPQNKLPGDLTGLIALSNAAISTSGDLEQSIVIEGTRYSHIVDPKTGLGLSHRRSVSVIAPTTTESDSLATACSVLDKTAALALIKKRGPAYHIRIRELDSNGELTVTDSKNFPPTLSAER